MIDALAVRRHDAEKAERILAERLEAVELVALDMDRVSGPELVLLLAESHPRSTGKDHHPVVVAMVLARGAATGGDVEVADLIPLRAVARADQLVPQDAGQGGILVLSRCDAIPASVPAPANDAHRRISLRRA